MPNRQGQRSYASNSKPSSPEDTSLVKWSESSEEEDKERLNAQKRTEELTKNFKKFQEEFMNLHGENETMSGPTAPFRSASFKPPTQRPTGANKAAPKAADPAKAKTTNTPPSEPSSQASSSSSSSSSTSSFNPSNDVNHSASTTSIGSIEPPSSSVPPPPPTSGSEDVASSLGRIEPKRITLEEAEALGIDTSSIRQPNLSPEERSKRDYEERLKRAAAWDGRPFEITMPSFDGLKGLPIWFWVFVGLIGLPPILQFALDPDHDLFEKTESWKNKERWNRTDYTYIADQHTESIIFEMCGMAAIGALPPFNPVTAPLHAVRGAAAPIYPRERQGLTPPVFWKLRIDFPGPYETVWEENDHLEATVRPASPDYRGSQFMWILARTWDRGEPVIRVLAGKQVGGTVKANPQRSLLPWRKPVFRPRRLGDKVLRKLESDFMFDSLFEEETNTYQYLKHWSTPEDNILQEHQSKQIGYVLEEFEFDMLDAKGYGDYMYDPQSVEWPPNNTLIVDPLGVRDIDYPSHTIDDRPDEFQYDDINDQYDQYQEDQRGGLNQAQYADDGLYDEEYEEYEEYYEEEEDEYYE